MFLHGAGGVPGWLPFFDRLSDQFDLLVPDHPSFGRSPLPPWLDDISDLAYFYLDLIDELNLKDVHLVGHSMGGWLALEMAIRSQARIKSLTLMASVGIRLKGVPVTNIFFLTPDQLMNALYSDPKIIAQELARQPTPAEIDQIVINRTAAARLGLASALLQSETCQVAASRHGADPDRVGQRGQDRVAGLCGGIQAPDSARVGDQ